MSKENEDESVDDAIDLEKEEADDLDTLDEEEDQGDNSSGDDEDDKPITLTKKELAKQIQDGIKNHFISKRHENKNRSKNYQPDSKKVDKNLDPINSRIDQIELRDAKREFGYQHNLPPKAVDLVFKLTDNKPSAKSLKDPFIAGGIERIKNQNSLRDNTPSGAGADSFEVGGKKFEEMTPEEKQKNFSGKQRQILSNKGKR